LDIIGTNGDQVDIGRLGALLDQGIIQVQAGWLGEGVVDEGQVNVGQYPWQLRRFDFTEAEVVGVVDHVHRCGFQVFGVVQLDQAGVVHEDHGTAAVGGIVGQGDKRLFGQLLNVVVALRVGTDRVDKRVARYRQVVVAVVDHALQVG